MENKTQKPASVAILELRQQLTQTLQASGLPPILAAPVLSELAQAWQQAAQEQTRAEWQQWQAAQDNAECGAMRNAEC